MGLGLIIGGISIILTQVQAIRQVLQFLLAALAFIPLVASPIMYFLPFVIGIDLVREIMINGATLMEIGWINITLLIINALVYFGIGVFVFHSCERFAMRRGLLGQY